MKLNATALIRSATGVVWLVVLMTLGAELSAPFKAYLAQLTGHHWVTKSLAAAAAFIVFYFLLQKLSESKNILKSVLCLIACVVLGGLIIFGFYLWHFLNG